MPQCLNCNNTSSFYIDIVEATHNAIVIKNEISMDKTLTAVTLKYLKCMECSSTSIKVQPSETYFEVQNEPDLEIAIEPPKKPKSKKNKDKLKQNEKDNIVKFQV